MAEGKYVYHCDWCRKEIENKLVLGGRFQEKKFCSINCRNNDHEYWNDNCHSDADLGL